MVSAARAGEGESDDKGSGLSVVCVSAEIEIERLASKTEAALIYINALALLRSLTGGRCSGAMELDTQ